jgi:hypothetical protein
MGMLCNAMALEEAVHLRLDIRIARFRSAKIVIETVLD